jgi:hypothetical protein
MKQEIKINVPTNWGGITLEKYLRLQKDIKVYGEDQNAYIACLFHHICDFNPEYLTQLDIDTFNAIKNDLVGFMGNTDLPLQRIITIDGVEYGFEPNLSKIAYGAYLDIVKFDTFQIDDNWSKIMSILYRPVVKKGIGGIYAIKDYDGVIDGEKFLNVGMDIHWGALFFFVRLLKVLPNSILNSLMESPEIPHNIKSILQKSGEIIAHSSNSLTEILEELKG